MQTDNPSSSGTNLFETGFFTRPLEGKSRNGDFGFSTISEDGTLFLAVSDGLGSYACDWKASRLAVEKTYQYWSESTEMNPAKRLETAIARVNQEILSESGACKGMKATLSVVIWNEQHHQVTWSSIGDSRIYVSKGTGIFQISADQKKDIIVRGPDGKLAQKDGTVAVRAGMTAAIGSDHPDILIQTIPDDGVFGFILVTDGIYEATGEFGAFFHPFFNAPTLDEGIREMVFQFPGTATDDQTLVAARLHRDRFMDWHTANQPPYSFINPWIQAAGQAIESGNLAGLDTLLGKARELNLSFSRSDCQLLLKALMEANLNHYDFYNWLVTRIRKSELFL